MESIKSKLKSDNLFEILYKSFFSFVYRVIGFIIGYAFVLIITNNLGAKGQGYYAIVYMLAMLFAMFAKMGIDVSMNKWCGIYNGNRDTYYLKKTYTKLLLLVLVGSIISATILFLTKGLLVAYFKDENLLNGIFIVIFLLPFLAVLDINASFFRGLKEIKWFGVYNQIGKYLFPFVVLLVFFFYSDLNIITPVYALVIGIIILSIVAFPKNRTV